MNLLRKPRLLAALLPIIAMAGTFVDAQIIWQPPPVLPVQAPVLVRPIAGTVHRYEVGSAGITFTWDQGPVFRTPTSPPYPTIFLQCLRRLGDPACSSATATSSDLAGSLASVPVRAFPSQIPLAYRYSATKTVPDNRLDQPISWEVAACRTAADSTCVRSAPRAMWFSTKDIAAANISANLYSSVDYNVSGEVRNLGSTPSGPFTIQIATWAAVIDASGGRCATDPNAETIRHEKALYVIDRRGIPTQFADLDVDSSGNYVAKDVIAIYRPGTFFQSGNFTARTQPPQQAGPVGVASQTLGIGTARPQAFVSAAIVDPFNTLVEFDETNNRHAECEVIF